MGARNAERPRGMRDVSVDPRTDPDWITAPDRLPRPGERVLTHEGEARVVAICGKISNGGRLLELQMDDGRRHPFFAASGNVLVRRDAAGAAESTDD